MFKLHLTQLAKDELIIFGPSRKPEDSKLSVKDEVDPSKSTHTSFRTVCITNIRVIIELGDSVIQVPNKDIFKVKISKSNKKGSLPLINIINLHSKTGATINVEIPGIELEKAKQLGNIFPNAVIKESRGIFKILDKFLGS